MEDSQMASRQISSSSQELVKAAPPIRATHRRPKSIGVECDRSAKGALSDTGQGVSADVFWPILCLLSRDLGPADLVKTCKLVSTNDRTEYIKFGRPPLSPLPCFPAREKFLPNRLFRRYFSRFGFLQRVPRSRLRFRPEGTILMNGVGDFCEKYGR